MVSINLGFIKCGVYKEMLHSYKIMESRKIVVHLKFLRSLKMILFKAIFILYALSNGIEKIYIISGPKK